MTSTPATEVADRQDERKRKRGAVIKFSLAGAALLGIAAAATSAAWTDNAWFSANATGATFELQGLNFDDPASYEDADAVGDAITVPADELQDLVPGQTRTFEINVKNAGSVDQTIVKNYEWVTSGTAGDFVATPTVSISSLTSLEAGADTDVTVTVTTPDSWAAGNQGKSEALRIVFTGSSIGD